MDRLNQSKSGKKEEITSVGLDLMQISGGFVFWHEKKSRKRHKNKRENHKDGGMRNNERDKKEKS